MIRQRIWFPVLYMFCTTALFSSMVIGLTLATKERVQANQKLAFERAVLTVLPTVAETPLSGPQIHRLFSESVTEPDESSRGAYTLRENGQIVAYVLPISGQGFWAPIKGLIGIDADRRTITGIAFYQQNETPGLGAEIDKPAFRNQFRGKVIASEGRPMDIKRPGSQLGPNEVHAVTGATQTSSRLERIINADLEKWRTAMQRKIGDQSR